MHQHKVLSARPKIEKGKKLLEPSFTLFLVLTVGPGIESTQNASRTRTWMTRFRPPAELLTFTTGTRGYCESQNAAERMKTNTQALFKQVKTKTSQVKKWTRKPTTRDKRSSDIYRMNPWKRPRTIKMRSNYISSCTSQFWKIKFSAQCSNSRQVTLKSNWARHPAINISATIGKFSMEL